MTVTDGLIRAGYGLVLALCWRWLVSGTRGLMRRPRWFFERALGLGWRNECLKGFQGDCFLRETDEFVGIVR